MSIQRFTEDQLTKANKVNIVEYARRMGYETVPASRQSWKIPDLGGLFIHVDGTRWNCFSQNIGGGPVQFVMHVQNKTWIEAMSELVGLPEELTSIRKNKLQGNGSQYSKKTQAQHEPMVLPAKGCTYKHIYAYLIAHRKIDRDIVNSLVKQRLLYENDKHSCVFVGMDSFGTPRFASVRSTNTKKESFRADVLNSDKSFSFNIKGSNSQLCVFESPIDLISYLTLLKRNGITECKSHMLSLGGMSNRALKRYLQAYPEIKTVTLCLDNDGAGKAATHKLTMQLNPYVNVNVHIPQRKDWNDDLVAQVEEDENREVEVQESNTYRQEVQVQESNTYRQEVRVQESNTYRQEVQVLNEIVYDEELCSR